MREKREVHFGWIFPICGEKNSELAEDDPLRKYEGRVVFQGNNVVNQSWESALFHDLGSSPATMEGSRAADLFGCAPGNDIMQADAPGAYCQTDMLGTETWACLPPEARPASWSHMKWPVVRLKKALYGHPDSGTWWEQHADRVV